MASAPLATRAPSPRPARRARVPLAAFLAVIVALAGAGAYLALGMLSGEDEAGGTPEVQLSSGPFGTAQEIPVSFGAFVVQNVEKTPGVRPRDVQGQTHNVQSLIGPDEQAIHATVGLTNLIATPVDFSPGQFRLVVGDGDRPGSDDKRIPATGGTVNAGSLQPDAGITGRLTFVAPRDGSRLWLEFKDPQQAKPVLVDLGRTGRTPEDAFDGFQHDGGAHP